MTEKFWAKTGKGNVGADGSYQYHPVICHLADTAAVAMAIVRSYLSPVAIATLERGLGLTDESLIKCCGFLAGCHDLGKVSPAFQFQVSDVGKALAGDILYGVWLELSSVRRGGKAPHGLITAKTMPEFLLASGLGSDLSECKAQRLANRLAMIVGGHHGFFPSHKEVEDLDDALCGLGEGNQWQHRRFAQTIFEQLQGFVGLTSADLPSQCDNAAAMILAGLTTVSDWIASNSDEETGFRYVSDMPFDEYKLDLPEKATRALTAIGWTKQPPSKPLSFRALFPKITEPRALQNSAIAIAEKLSAPCLVLVEASMGEGKTEAALYLADYLQHQATSGGFYIGLPTQATSNAMWKRVREFLLERYPESVVNLTLSHSAAALKEEYQQTVCRLDQVYDAEGKVVASEWHTARRKSLLSPYGVGTIDQALMGAVRSKWQFVRLFGLAGRTVILDEIHAYDLYTSTLLERFLEWLALLGSPVIALSATLPADTRCRLVNAYAQGCGCKEPVLPIDKPYPRLTTFTPEDGANVTSFPASKHVTRSLNLHWVSDEEWVIALQEKLAAGGCAAVICSTVARSQAVFERLQKHFASDALGLFHGRFLFVNRDRIEKDCQNMFGKDSVKFIDLVKCLIASQDFPNSRAFITYLLAICCRTRPYRYVLVATQVIEQSLDLDFDLMISDLAPVDLLLQRSGRLHRHEKRQNRPANLTQPNFWLIVPTLEADGKAKFGDSELIYDRHVLLRSWLTLRDRVGDCASIQLPEEMDTLIESVYALNATFSEDLEAIHATDWTISLEQYCKKSADLEDNAKKVRLPPGIKQTDVDEFTRHKNLPLTEDDEHALAKTRLGEPTVTTIFLQQTDAGLVLPSLSRQPVDLEELPDLKQIRELLAHSVRISKGGLVQEILAQPNPKKWTSALLRYSRHVVLNSEGVALMGKWQLTLDPLQGIVISKKV